MDMRYKRHFEQLLRSEEYSDFTITCCNVQWRLHRSILAARSGFFKKLFQESPTRESYDPHAPQGTQSIIDLALQSIYTGDYSIPSIPHEKYAFSQSNDFIQTEIICHSVLRRFAEIWQIPDLRDLTLEREERVLRENIDRLDIGWAITPYYLGWRGTGYMPTTSSWSSGHRLNVTVIRQNKEKLLREPSFQNILTVCPDFATDLNGEYEFPSNNQRSYVSKTACRCSMPHGFELQCAGCRDVFVRGRVFAAPVKKEEQLKFESQHSPVYEGDQQLAAFEFPDLTDDDVLDCPCPFPTDAMFVCTSCGVTMCTSVKRQDPSSVYKLESSNGVKAEAPHTNDDMKTES